MAFGMSRHRATRAAFLSASTALAMTFSGGETAFAQATGQTVAEAESISFSIPAQPLTSALNSFARATGWQLGYQTALTSGRQSTSVSGRYTPLAALQSLLSGTGISIRVTGPRTVSLVEGSAEQAPGADGATVLETIIIKSAGNGVMLGTNSPADTGTSTLSGGQLTGRIDGNDANGVLRNLPNIQYQNDASDDAGATDLSVIDLRPREVSISGARLYENNFILNGIGINDVTGSQEGYSSDATLQNGRVPHEGQIYGLHSQTIYVPGEFVSEATVIDSNASAKYGNFQGGVVSYKMADANRERLSGSISTEYTNSDWANYHIATPDGLNPLNIVEQNFLKRRFSAEFTGPITENIAVLGQYSKQEAITHKPKYPQYVSEGMIEQDSANEFYRGQLIADTDLGAFTLEGFYTDYNMFWENASWPDMRINLAKDALATKLQNDYEFEDFSLGGVDISNAKLTSTLSFGRSKSVNDSNENVGGVIRTSFSGDRISTISDWCRRITTITAYTNCYYGALGDLYQSQDQSSFAQELNGDVWNGSFRLGGGYTHTEASRRRPEEVTYYSVYTNARNLGDFVCNTAEACNAEMFGSTKQIRPAFDLGATLNELNGYAELDQTWDWFNLRAGLRINYDDYMNNVDVAPRIVATIQSENDLSLSAGFNRYFDAQSLSFAIRDQQPKPRTYTRTAAGRVVDDNWISLKPQPPYTNIAADLKTPYNDEITLALSGEDSYFGGAWRLRYLHRSAKDQFASEKTSPSYHTLTNDAHGSYQSATAEYFKDFDIGFVPKLDNISFNTSITWSRQEVSNNSYYEDDLEQDRVWYNNSSYPQAGFNVVTGNLDIPLRLQAGISTSWFDDKLFVDVSGNYNFAYRGVRNTEVGRNVDGVQHVIWEDFDFDSTLTVDLAATYLVYRKNEANLSLSVKVLNLLDEAGNGQASHTNPWVIGRTVWVGAKAAF